VGLKLSTPHKSGASYSLPEEKRVLYDDSYFLPEVGAEVVLCDVESLRNTNQCMLTKTNEWQSVAEFGTFSFNPNQDVFQQPKVLSFSSVQNSGACPSHTNCTITLDDFNAWPNTDCPINIDYLYRLYNKEARITGSSIEFVAAKNEPKALDQATSFLQLAFGEVHPTGESGLYTKQWKGNLSLRDSDVNMNMLITAFVDNNDGVTEYNIAIWDVNGLTPRVDINASPCGILAECMRQSGIYTIIFNELCGNTTLLSQDTPRLPTPHQTPFPDQTQFLDYGLETPGAASVQMPTIILYAQIIAGGIAVVDLVALMCMLKTWRKSRPSRVEERHSTIGMV
jgi:hypothetical protein